MKPNIVLDVAAIVVKPNFDVIKKYLYQSVSDEKYKAFIKKYQKNKSIIALPFISDADGDILADNLASVLNKYPLKGHGTNLAFIILTLYKQTYYEAFEGRIPFINNLTIVENAQTAINYIVKNKQKKLKITFEEIGEEVGNATKVTKDGIAKKRNKIICDNPQITNWLISMLYESILTGGIPISFGQHMLDSKILGNVEDKTEYFKIQPSAYYEQSSFQTIMTDAIVEVAIRVIAYLEGENLITKGKAKYWSFDQLTLAIDIIILIDYYKSSSPNFVIGTTEPTVEDKKYLDTTLNNKLKQGKLKIINAIDTALKVD